MEENKNITPENKRMKFKLSKEKIMKAPKKLKNSALLKRGSYSVAITVAFVAGAILLNILVGALSNRFVLEFDISADQSNFISDENMEYIKSVKDNVNITVCADENDYKDGYMAYYASQLYGANGETDGSYYKQTINLIKKYDDYSKYISVDFFDTQSSEFSKIMSEYADESLSYGDIIVSAEKDGIKRHKIIKYNDIYNLTQDTTYASYGYTYYNITGNNIETALTSAVAYSLSAEDKKVAIISGHSANDYTENYKSLLITNNYEVDYITDAIVNSISDEYDAILIAAPTTDFLDTELDVLSSFLDNDGKLGKGLIFFGDASSPYLPNFYEFLGEWGITVEEGVLYQTNSNYHIPDDPTTLYIYSSGNDTTLVNDTNICVAGKNIPLTTAFSSQDSITVTSILKTPESVVAAPVGTAKGWADAGDYEKGSYCGLIQAVKTDLDDDNNKLSSYVMAFSSTEYINSSYAEMSALSNKNVSFSVAERAVGAENTGISFLPKTITNESFAGSVTDSGVAAIKFIFIFLLPAILIVAGIVVYIKRRNA